MEKASAIAVFSFRCSRRVIPVSEIATIKYMAPTISVEFLTAFGIVFTGFLTSSESVVIESNPIKPK